MATIIKTYRMVVNQFYDVDIMEPEMKIFISEFPDPTFIKHLYGQEALEFYRFILENPGLTCIGGVFKIQFVIKKGELIQLNVFKISDDNEYIKRSLDYPMGKSEKWPKVLKDIFGISFPIEEKSTFKVYRHHMRFFYNRCDKKMCLEIRSEDGETNAYFDNEAIIVFGRITGLYSIPMNGETDEYFNVKITVEETTNNPVLMVVMWEIGLHNKTVRSILEEDLKKSPWPNTLEKYFQLKNKSLDPKEELNLKDAISELDKFREIWCKPVGNCEDNCAVCLFSKEDICLIKEFINGACSRM